MSVFPVYWAITMSLRPTLLTFSMPPVFIFRPTLEHYKAASYQAMAMSPSNCQIPAQQHRGVTGYHRPDHSCREPGRIRTVQVSVQSKNGIAFFILATRMLPPVGTIIPIFLVMLRLNLLDTRISLILAYRPQHPAGHLDAEGFFDEIPVELEEAALVDGCSEARLCSKSFCHL